MHTGARIRSANPDIFLHVLGDFMPLRRHNTACAAWRAWRGCDRGDELEPWVGSDALRPLWQVQLPPLQKPHQAGQHVRRRQVDILNQKPPPITHRLHMICVSDA